MGFGVSVYRLKGRARDESNVGYTRVNVSLYDFHYQWVEERREEDPDFNFSQWIREQIEEEANDAPAFMEVDE